ncbi:hypothetical protein PoB_002440500 [Plakobranchus ocellatus]|uniref:Alpha-macroglobulin-like TED domain-containing protein n=1 Tax=Plakobranchus ocellatus TaxID=259542 RepID=A0AAV3ZTE9_9GAST|nr:hypothetical protein PoB_002440500 [Plakobranchus ocellatus]
MASYALMSYLHFSPNHARKIAMWLIRQRNSFGGFASTQDTLVALDALSQFAASAYSRDSNELMVKVKFKNTAKPSSVDFYVSDVENNTRFLLKSTPIPTLPSTLHISATGKGCALVQANVRYNTPARPYANGEKIHFTLQISVKPYQYGLDECHYRTLAIKVRTRRGHSVSKGMGLVTLQMFTSWSPTSRSLFKLESSYSTIGIKGVEYVKKEGLLHIYFEKFSRKSKWFLVDVAQDKEDAVYYAKKAYIRAVEYYDTGVTTAKSYRIKTTRRCKEKNKEKDELATDDIMQQMSSSNETSPNACPACITTWKIPPNFRSTVCSAAAVYTALAGRKKARSIKLNQNLRPIKTETRLKHFVFPRMPPGCECSLFSKDGRPKQVMIVTDSTAHGKYLTIDQYSTIMRNSRKARAEARAAQETCPF